MMLKYLLASIVVAIPLSLSVGAQNADAGIFANRPVRSFFQERKPVRKLLRASVKVVAAPVKFVATKKPVRSALKAVAGVGSCNSSAKSSKCSCENCTCVNCDCGG